MLRHAAGCGQVEEALVVLALDWLLVAGGVRHEERRRRWRLDLQQGEEGGDGCSAALLAGARPGGDLAK